MTTPPCRRCCADGSSGQRMGTRSFCPAGRVLIDGGETHARAAQTVAWEFGVDVPIFGMVKDDRHRTRALVTPEGREIGIVTQQAVFSLIGQIQEETHRFAITYHHESHSKSATRSALDRYPRCGREAAGRSCGNTSAPSRPSGRRMWRPLPPWCPGRRPRRCGNIFTRKTRTSESQRHSRWLFCGR